MEAGGIKDMRSSEKIAGTIACPYKIAIIGGGPAGCSVIVRAIRIGLIDDLCNFSSTKDENNIVTTTAGVLLIEKNNVDKFGGGRLQDYVINSNTFAKKFVSNIIEERPENLPPEKIKETVLEKLNDKSSAVELARYGEECCPLTLVGEFLRETGGAVMEKIHQYPKSSSCLTGTSVQAIQQVCDENGKFMYWKVTTILTKDLCGNLETENNISIYYCKQVLLATGGQQNAPKFSRASHSAKVLTSDVVCTESGVEELRRRLRKFASVNGGTVASPGRVVIVGGSHSAFSAAWICLNKIKSLKATPSEVVTPAVSSSDGKPGKKENNKKEDKKDCNTTGQKKSNILEQSSPPEEVLFGPCSICVLHRSNIKVFYATKHEADRDKYIYSPPITVGSSTNLTVTTSEGSSGQFYGPIHQFGGLRADAKSLWQKIRSGMEPRVRLLRIRTNIEDTRHSNPDTSMSLDSPGSGDKVIPGKQASKQNAAKIEKDEPKKGDTVTTSDKACEKPPVKATGPWRPSLSLQEKLFDEAAVIIWACGYSSNLIPVLDCDGKQISLHRQGGQIEVNECAQLLYEDEQTIDSRVNSTFPTPSEKKNCSKGSEEPSAEEKPGLKEPRDKLSAPHSPSKTVTRSGSIDNSSAVLSPPSKKPESIENPATRNGQKRRVVEGLLGAGLGFGFLAPTDGEMIETSSLRADGVAVYLKKGATIILAQILGNKVFGGQAGEIKSWDQRLNVMRKIAIATAALTSPSSQTPSPSKAGNNSSSNGSSVLSATASSLSRISSKHKDASASLDSGSISDQGNSNRSVSTSRVRPNTTATAGSRVSTERANSTSRVRPSPSNPASPSKSTRITSNVTTLTLPSRNRGVQKTQEMKPKIPRETLSVSAIAPVLDPIFPSTSFSPVPEPGTPTMRNRLSGKALVSNGPQSRSRQSSPAGSPRSGLQPGNSKAILISGVREGRSFRYSHDGSTTSSSEDSSGPIIGEEQPQAANPASPKASLGFPLFESTNAVEDILSHFSTPSPVSEKPIKPKKSNEEKEFQLFQRHRIKDYQPLLSSRRVSTHGNTRKSPHTPMAPSTEKPGVILVSADSPTQTTFFSRSAPLGSAELKVSGSNQTTLKNGVHTRAVVLSSKPSKTDKNGFERKQRIQPLDSRIASIVNNGLSKETSLEGEMKSPAKLPSIQRNSS